MTHFTYSTYCRWTPTFYIDLLHCLSSYYSPIPHLHPSMDGQSQAIRCHRVPKEAEPARSVHCTSISRWSANIVCTTAQQHGLKCCVLTQLVMTSSSSTRGHKRSVDASANPHSPHRTNSGAVHEKRLLGYHEHASSQRMQPLEFPPFHRNVLIQSSWDAREENGRIKLLLSEQLVSNTNSPGDLSFGATNDIVCFSFQHAPRGKCIAPSTPLSRLLH